MQMLAASAAKSAIKSQAKSAIKEYTPQEPRKGGRRKKDTGSLGDRAQGCCNRCCEKTCRTSPWTQCLCWALIALTLSTVLVWLGGAFLVGPAKKGGGDGCGVNIIIPLLNKDAYIWFLKSTGIIVSVMVFASCIFCCSFVALCCGYDARFLKCCGGFGLVLALAALSVFMGWLALGTYFVIRERSGSTICRNTLIEVILLYVYLFVLAIVVMVAVVWKCHDLVEQRNTTTSRKLKYQRLPTDSD